MVKEEMAKENVGSKYKDILGKWILRTMVRRIDRKKDGEIDE